jgi:superfamily I DNA/RNA helicase
VVPVPARGARAARPRPLSELFEELAAQQREPLTGALRLLGEERDVSSVMDALGDWEPSVLVSEELSELWRGDRKVLLERWRTYSNRVESRERSWQGVLIEMMDRPREERSGIRVLTVHAAKGLEFRALWIVGLNDGSFPDFRGKDSTDGLMAERRLAYVAVTRAARVLRLSRPRIRRTRYGTWRDQTESPYIKEMQLVMHPR